MACLSKRRWTGIESFPRKRLIIGRLFANLSLTSISRTSVGRETKLNCCNKGRTQNMKLVARPHHHTAASSLSTSASLWIFHRTETVLQLQGIGLQKNPKSLASKQAGESTLQVLCNAAESGLGNAGISFIHAMLASKYSKQGSPMVRTIHLQKCNELCPSNDYWSKCNCTDYVFSSLWGRACTHTGKDWAVHKWQVKRRLMICTFLAY